MELISSIVDKDSLREVSKGLVEGPQKTLYRYGSASGYGSTENKGGIERRVFICLSIDQQD